MKHIFVLTRALNSNTVLTCALNRGLQIQYCIGCLLKPPCIQIDKKYVSKTPAGNSKNDFTKNNYQFVSMACYICAHKSSILPSSTPTRRITAAA